MIGFSRPFWPLFLHVLGAMTLFGAVLTVAVVSAAAWRRPALEVLRRSAFSSAVASLLAYALMRGAAGWIYAREGWTGHGDPTWLGIGFAVADAGLVVLVAILAAAYWWRRSARPLAGRIVTALSGAYLLLLALAWLAMSGKWS